MLPKFETDEFLTQIAELQAKGAFNSYLLSITALLNGYDVIFYRTQKEANTSIPHFPSEVADPVFFAIRSGKKITHFASSRSEFSDLKTHQIVENKSLLKAHLSQAGINVPFGGAASIQDFSILNKFHQAGVNRVTVKPVIGKGSRGVRLNQTLDQAKHAIHQNPGQVFIIEQMITGVEFRITASRAAVVAAQMISQPHVIGDGKSTLKHLVEREIEARKRNPAFLKRELDPRQILQMYALQKAQDSDILENGKKFWLTSDGLPNFAFRVPVLERLPSHFKKIATRTVQIIKGSICGMDIVADQAGVPYVLDIDAVSGMWFECFPHPTGAWNLDVPEYVLKKNFPKHRCNRRQILSYDYTALKAELLREDRQSKGVNAADFVVFA